MKIYFSPSKMTMVGKAWQIKAKLREYQTHADLLQDFLRKQTTLTSLDRKQ